MTAWRSRCRVFFPWFWAGALGAAPSARVLVPIAVDGRDYTVDVKATDSAYEVAAAFCRTHHLPTRECNRLAEAIAEKQRDAATEPDARRRPEEEEDEDGGEGEGEDPEAAVVAEVSVEASVDEEADPPGAIDFSRRVPPVLTVTKPDGTSFAVERYVGESSATAVDRACRTARFNAQDCDTVRAAFDCLVAPSAPGCEAKDASPEDAEAPPRWAWLRSKAKSLLSLVAAFALVAMQHHHAQEEARRADVAADQQNQDNGNQ